VFSEAPVRQFVLTFPFPPRFLLAAVSFVMALGSLIAVIAVLLLPDPRKSQIE
jgi:hypothetical protein